jgi:hypothetical protein
LLSDQATAGLQHLRRLRERAPQTDCLKSRIVYFFNRSRRPRSYDQRGLGNGVDVQIGGGMHGGDAFQAIVGPKPIVNMGTGKVVSEFLKRGV